MFNVTFSNISAISRRPVLVMEKAGILTAHGQVAESRVHPFCNLQSRARTHAVLVIGLYELLGNPTTWQLLVNESNLISLKKRAC